MSLDAWCAICKEQGIPLRVCDFVGCGMQFCDACFMVHDPEHEDDCTQCGLNVNECRCGEEDDL